MFICICNQIDEESLKRDPSLGFVCGSSCGSCADMEAVRVAREASERVSEATPPLSDSE